MSECFVYLYSYQVSLYACYEYVFYFFSPCIDPSFQPISSPSHSYSMHVRVPRSLCAVSRDRYYNIVNYVRHCLAPFFFYFYSFLISVWPKLCALLFLCRVANGVAAAVIFFVCWHAAYNALHWWVDSIAYPSISFIILFCLFVQQF